MSNEVYAIQPQDWIRTTVSRIADANHDASIAFRLWHIGTTYPYARVNIATTTGDMIFRQGSASGVGATIGSVGVSGLSTTKGDNPKSGGTAGLLDISQATVNNMFKLVSRINNARDWSAALIDSLCTDPTEFSANNGVFLPGTTTSSDGAFDTLKKTVQGVSTAENLITGANFILDTSLKSKEFFYAGVTLNDSKNKIPQSDAGVLHEIIEVRVKATYATTGGTISFWKCNDAAGTDTQLGGAKPITAASTATEFVFSVNGEPIESVRGARYVVRVSAGTSATAASLRSAQIKIVRRSVVFAPAIRRHKTWAWVNQAKP